MFIKKYFKIIIIKMLKGITKFLSNKSFTYKKFSTLIVPEINHSRINPSVHNLVTAALKLQSEVTSNLLQTHILLYGDKVSEESINSSKKLKDISKIIVFEDPALKNPSSEYVSSIITVLQKQYNYESIIGPSNNYGKNILPRVGGLLDVQPISDVIKIESKTRFSRLFYAGNAFCTIESSQKPNIMTIRLTSFDKTNEADNQAEVVKFDNKFDFSSIKSSSLKENIISKTDKVELTSAKVVISGGRSLKSAENFKMLDELATCFDSAAIGASRAAVDAGYVPNDLQIGQTGKIVAPEIYFAIGISGAIQHVAGMKDSKVIVAINSDGDSPIFQVF